MSAFKKTSVAAMVMLLCIVIALICGKYLMKDEYANPGNKSETVTETIYNMTTYGTISEAYNDAVTDKTAEDEAKEEKAENAVGIIILIFVAFFILKGIGKKK